MPLLRLLSLVNTMTMTPDPSYTISLDYSDYTVAISTGMSHQEAMIEQASLRRLIQYGVIPPTVKIMLKMEEK
jgi:hypothetical protein